MPVIVDASFVIPLLIDETQSEFARDIFESWGSRSLAAPAMLHWEVANVLWKKARRQEIDLSQMTEAGQVFDELRIELFDPVESVHRLAQTAIENDLTAYDASYLSLALVSAAELATTDRGLTKAALRAGLVVHSPFA